MDPVLTTDYVTPVYAAYATVSVGLTVWLAQVLRKNGQVFLDRVFSHDPGFSVAVNQLLVVGFYLVNFGFAALHMVGGHAADPRTAVELLAQKLGSLLLVLAAMHFSNLYVFNRIRKSASAFTVEPPIAPQQRIAVEHAPAGA